MFGLVRIVEYKEKEELLDSFSFTSRAVPWVPSISSTLAIFTYR